jgi:DNA (cytosine-5)-methyltransferase 1
MYTLNATGVHGVAQPIAWDEELNASINIAGTIVRGGQGGRHDGVAQPIAFTSEQTPKASSNLAHTLTNTTFKHNQMVAFSSNMSVPNCQIDVSPTLKLGGKGGGNPPAVAQPIPIETMNHIGWKDSHSFGDFKPGAPSYTLTKGHSHAVATNMAVRRLTPVECERLQGFPDNYTNIPWRKSDESPDGPRYKALGNSMAVPVMAWIGRRIQEVEAR